VRRFGWTSTLSLGLAGFPLSVAEPQNLDPSLTTRIDSVFRRFSSTGPGCAIGVVQGSHLTFAKGYGLASLESKAVITPTTVFDLGSVSKQFTAMAILLLEQDGKLSLDDPIQRFVPEIPRYANPVTIRHLLHHTSGLRDYIDLLVWSGVPVEAVAGDQISLDVLARQQRGNFDAGTEYRYSNTGYFLLSVIVKRASGTSLRDFANRRIFGPLGMRSSFFLDDHAEVVLGKAGSYSPRRGGGFRLELSNWEQTGDGGVQTTVADMALWMENLVSGKVGGPEALRALTTPGSLSNGTAIGYAMGLTADRYRGTPRISHGGSWVGFRAFVARFPDHSLSLITLCNRSDGAPGTLVMQTADVLLEGKLGPATPANRPAGPEPDRARSDHPLREYTGVYHSDELLTDWRVTLEGDRLVARAGPAMMFTFQRTNGTFAMDGAPVRFLEEGGRITGLVLQSRGARDFSLTRRSDQP